LRGLIDELRDTHRPPPVVEPVEDVRLAELDAHRAAARPLRVVTLAVAIDAAVDDGERDSLRRPTRHLDEHRTGNPDQVTFVLPSQVGFDFPAVLGYFCH